MAFIGWRRSTESSLCERFIFSPVFRYRANSAHSPSSLLSFRSFPFSALHDDSPFDLFVLGYNLRTDTIWCMYNLLSCVSNLAVPSFFLVPSSTTNTLLCELYSCTLHGRVRGWDGLGHVRGRELVVGDTSSLIFEKWIAK